MAIKCRANYFGIKDVECVLLLLLSRSWLKFSKFHVQPRGRCEEHFKVIICPTNTVPWGTHLLPAHCLICPSAPCLSLLMRINCKSVELSENLHTSLGTSFCNMLGIVRTSAQTLINLKACHSIRDYA